MLTNSANVMGATSMVASISTVLYVRTNFTKLRKESKRQSTALSEVITELESQSSTFKAAQKLKKTIAYHSKLFEYYDNELTQVNDELKDVQHKLNQILKLDKSQGNENTRDKPKRITKIRHIRKAKPKLEESEESEEEYEEDSDKELSETDEQDLNNIMNNVKRLKR